MRIGVPKETVEGERRVALVPDVVRKLVAQGHEVVVEPGAGDAAGIPDELYGEAGATVGDGAWDADVVAKVAPPQEGEVSALGKDSVLVGFLAPLTNGAGNKAIAATGATAFAMEAIPRISRAQSMDALSSARPPSRATARCSSPPRSWAASSRC